MDKRVLVATPANPATPQFLPISERLYSNLAYPNKDRAVYLGVPEGPFEARHSREAMARNELIEQFLKPEHDYVLWVDVDLVNIPLDLVEQLMAISDHDVVAPIALIENTHAEWPQWRDRFIDIGGFIENGHRTRVLQPYFDAEGPVIQLDSVGTCYLIPADVYRRGGRYAPQGEDVEHVSLMAFARKLGYKVLADTRIKVWHAFMPDYGELWHAG